MARMDAPPKPIVRLIQGRLQPVGAYDAEVLDSALPGSEFELAAISKRYPPRNAAYWAGLGAAVKATDAWPTSKHLHDDLKRLCGYVDWYLNPLTGREEMRVQSAAFDKMNEAEFRAYFQLAQMRFAEKMGFDPWRQR